MYGAYDIYRFSIIIGNGPQDHPRTTNPKEGGLMQHLESVCWGVVCIHSLTWKWKRVSWFQSFLVSMFQSFKIKKSFDGFKRCCQIPFHVFFWRYWSRIQDFKNLLDWSSGFFGARLFQNVQNLDSRHFGISQNNMFQWVWFFLDYLRYLGVAKDNNSWFWEPGWRPKIQIMNMEVFGLSHKQVEKL